MTEKQKKTLLRFISSFLIISFIVPIPLKANAVVDYYAEAEARKSLPVQSNSYENWPDGPAIGAESAILLEVNTGTILYAKNMDEQLFPASTTKILTCLLAVENSTMDEMVDFSYDAVFSVPRDGSNMGIDVGESLSMEDCLYGILVGSANEVAAAVGEHIAGDAASFADMMNERAKELGCTNTHFTNANGLHDDNHYTTAYDLAKIAVAFFSNEYLTKVADTPRVHFEPTATQPDDFYLNNKNKLINGEISYDYYIGGKTGYTDEARQTLVSCAENNGMKLICVIMKEESPDQFNDTVTLFDYGFNNFQRINVSDVETKYTIADEIFFTSGTDIFGNSTSIMQLSKDDYIVVPNVITFEEVTSEISYDNLESDQVAVINYTYNSIPVGSVSVDLIGENSTEYTFGEAVETPEEKQENTFFINVKAIILWLLGIAVALTIVFVIITFVRNYHFGGRRGRRSKRRRKRRSVSPYRHFNFDDIDLRK